MKRKERNLAWRFALSVAGATIVAIGTSWDGGAADLGRRHQPERVHVAVGDRGGNAAPPSFRRLEKPADARLPYRKHSASDERAAREVPAERASDAGEAS